MKTDIHKNNKLFPKKIGDKSYLYTVIAVLYTNFIKFSLKKRYFF